MTAHAEVPQDLVVVGRVLDAWGLQGGLKVARFSPDAEALHATSHWWLTKAGQTQRYKVLSAEDHGQVLRVALEGIGERDGALTLKGAQIAVARSEFPALLAGEYYWVDLVGLAVTNLAGERLGEVSEVTEAGAHPILVVDAGQQVQLLIPFVGAVVSSVDLVERRIEVDWQKDY